MIKDLSVDHLLGIKQLTAEDIEIIFETADSFKKIIVRKENVPCTEQLLY